MAVRALNASTAAPIAIQQHTGWRAAERDSRQMLEALDVAVYTTDREGRLTFFNDAAALFWGRKPELGELWCGSYKLFHPDGSPMAHDECPMAVALREGRELRGVEAIAERPDGSRVAFTPYPTVLRDPDGTVIGAVNILVDITDRIRVEDSLRASAEALRASNAVKDEFLGLVSHELRTPVTTIFGNARLLRDRGDRLAESDRESMVSDIAGEAERLLGVVENLLLLTRLESGIHPDPEPQVLAHVARMMLDSFERRHPDRSIELRSEPRHLIVEADRPYLDLILENLLTNAVKYSPARSPIEVVIQATEAEAQLLVLDRGIGLDGTDMEQLFTAFYRSESARSHSAGLGIGLAACKRVVESLGGRVWAAPREGGGSEFGFALPLA
ncbi:MAG: PAS domain S-box protein [Chloroflexi bacterium]|nr:MAG: PAS domain S-box protein [Chloroflexota bacterium]TME13420.1 MAG: PAS domain S-box protein [Chloroflexota bacterium]